MEQDFHGSGKETDNVEEALEAAEQQRPKEDVADESSSEQSEETAAVDQENPNQQRNEILAFAGVAALVVALILVAVLFGGKGSHPGGSGVGTGIGGAGSGSTFNNVTKPKASKNTYQSNKLRFTFPSGSTSRTIGFSGSLEEARFIVKGNGMRVRSQPVVDEGSLKEIAADWKAYGKVERLRIGNKNVVLVTVSNTQLTSVMAAYLHDGRVVYVQAQGPVPSKAALRGLVRQVTSSVRITNEKK